MGEQGEQSASAEAGETGRLNASDTRAGDAESNVGGLLSEAAKNQTRNRGADMTPEARYTRWLVGVTGILAAATIVLAISTIALAKFTKDLSSAAQRESEALRDESSVLKEELITLKEQTEAMKKSVDISIQTAVTYNTESQNRYAAQLPKISSNMYTSGSLLFTEDMTASIPIKFVVSNSGEFTANDVQVTFILRLVQRGSAPENGELPDDRVCSTGNKLQTPPVIIDNVQRSVSVDKDTVIIADAKYVREISGKDSIIVGATVVECISYMVDNRPTNTDPFVFDIQWPATVGEIYPDKGPTEIKELRLERRPRRVHN